MSEFTVTATLHLLDRPEQEAADELFDLLADILDEEATDGALSATGKETIELELIVDAPAPDIALKRGAKVIGVVLERAGIPSDADGGVVWQVERQPALA